MDENSNNASISPNQPVNQSPLPVPQAVAPVSSPAPQVNPEPIIQNPQPPEQPAEANPFYLTFGFWAFIFFLGNLIAIFFFWIYPLLSPPLVVENQPLGEGFSLKRARVTSPGFIALKVEVTGGQGPTILTIANSSLLTPDTYEDFYLSRQSKQTLPDEFLAAIKEGSSVSVAVYNDVNQDREFDPGADNSVMKDIFGRKIQTSFILE